MSEMDESSSLGGSFWGDDDGDNVGGGGGGGAAASASAYSYTYTSEGDSHGPTPLPPPGRVGGGGESGSGGSSQCSVGSHFEVIDAAASLRAVASLRGEEGEGGGLGAPVGLEEVELRRTLTLSSRTRLYLAKAIKSTDSIPGAPEAYAMGGEGRGGEAPKEAPKLLGQALASGICCNNISSSVLYVVALCAAPAGKYAPIALLLICGLLYLFRSVYTESVLALPGNGGTYNLLLNTTTKAQAAGAACLTMLSYVATAVISSSSAIRYVKTLAEDSEWFNVITFTIALLGFVAILNLLGITESAGVALGIFVMHMSSVFLLLIFSAIKAIRDMPMVGNETVLSHNWTSTNPDGGFGAALFFGFSAALLGISGFESSANYVESQKPGVFPKTLRNMWLVSVMVNPTTAFLAQCLLPMAEIEEQATEGALLSQMARVAGGRWLEILITVDAGLVLTGAVVSAFVGNTGLITRLALDRCLPQALLKTNSLRGTYHWIIIGMWLLTSAMVLFSGGQIEIMAGVYTIAFLAVMSLFCIGNMLLKLRRATLPTPVRASWPTVLVAFTGVVLGLVGNVISRDQTALAGFFIFGLLFALPVLIMLNRTQLLRMIAAATASFADGVAAPALSTTLKPGDALLDVVQDPDDDNDAPVVLEPRKRSWFARQVALRIHYPAKNLATRLENKPLVFFTSTDSPAVQAKVIAYVSQNELRKWVKFIRVYGSADDVPSSMPRSYQMLGEQHPNFCIDYVAVVGEFTPSMVTYISHVLHIPTMFMFMSSFGPKFPYSYSSMGGLRLLV